MTISAQSYDELPAAADLRHMFAQQPLPVIAPGTVDADLMSGDEATKQAQAVVDALNAAVAADDAKALEGLFFSGSKVYWKDSLALTAHLRTFTDADVISSALLETAKLRAVSEFKVEGVAKFLPATPVLQFIDSGLSFKTGSPGATCSGRILLLPVKDNDRTQWKIWIFSTRIESLDIQKEDESLLKNPGRQLDGLQTIETDVFIIGGGNAAVALAARLKALGVESVMAERSARPGDNWALRYDCMKFHIPTAFCELPYMTYDKHLQTPHLLTKDELAEQVRRYVATFHLNIINSAKIVSAKYDQSTQQWTVKFETPAGLRTAVSKHLVQATGIGSQKPYVPPMADQDKYKGISIHSAQFKNGKELADKGAKSALIIGSANTAFDILVDIHAAGLRTTLNARSPTYIVPLSYVCDPLSLGAYDVLGVDAADRNFLTLPTAVDGQLAKGLFAAFASREPERYSKLAAAGFPVLDSAHPDCALASNLLERAGGHYVDVGGTSLIADGKAAVKAGVAPVAFTADGVRFADGSEVQADAVVWCTGFRDKNVRDVAAEALGGGEVERGIAARLDATWGVDAEGEIRGMWKRHARVDNFWVMGGFTQQHRWHSATLAVQIKAALEGVLPEAYRGTPAPRTKGA
ncbi:putative flavin-containing monooxygenase protein [Lasiodiplodia theobromae]|nr:putative flavin-containing monooxygenase protein [Lasiodiplodia theobromae]